MNHISQSTSLARCGLVILALALTGCHREQVTVQDVPKESDSAMQQPADAARTEQMPNNPHAGMDMAPGGGAALPQVKWTLPAGWQDKALSEMRVGSFDAKGADVSIIPLPSGGPQMELGNYNMWRGELQLPAASQAESQPVTVGSEQGKLYDISGGKVPGRIMVAQLDRDGMSWYFKIRGDDATVQAQKPAFLEFLKSISFEAAPAAAPAMAMTDPHASMGSMGMDAGASGGESMASAGVPLPAGWKQVPAPSQFLLAKYDIEGSGGAKAEVNVSALAGTGGGVIMNVNRWRGQLGLGPISEEDFSKQAQTLDVAGSKATVVDLTGTDSKTGQKSRLIGVIAPQADQTWFYKLMGDGQIVEQQKDAFTKFVQTAKFGN